MVNEKDACEIIKLAEDAGIKVFLDGGWGVDALLERETRIHNDIDLFVDEQNYSHFIQIIKDNGFREIKMEYTTAAHRVWKDERNRIIDLHCFSYDETGNLIYEGEHFPLNTFSGEGMIGGIKVSCIEPASQVMFHLGYEHDDNDAHDVKLLCETFHIEIPEEYK